MIRSMEDLIKEAKECRLNIEGFKTKEEVVNVLAKHHAKANRPGKTLLQIHPMLGRDILDLSKEEQDKILKDDNDWIAEKKLDGIRAIMHIGSRGNRFTTRERSVKNYFFREITDNLPHLKDYPLGKWDGTILDGEAVLEKQIVDTGSTKAYGTLSVTAAICNASPEKAEEIQERAGWISYHAFDIIKYKGVPLLNRPFGERRKFLEEMFDEIRKESSDLASLILVAQIAKNKRRYYNEIIKAGGEGIMLKNLNGLYQTRGRSKAMYKMKKHLTVDGWISGYTEGRRGFEGLIGSLLISVRDEEGIVREIAGVSPNAEGLEPGEVLELRKSMTEVVSGKPTLKKDYYGRVVEVLAYDWSKSLRLSHARILRWRPDKIQDECIVDLSQVKRRFGISRCIRGKPFRNFTWFENGLCPECFIKEEKKEEILREHLQGDI